MPHLAPGTPKKKLALIVNPIAGMGGSVGLKGTDGKQILLRAIELGATQIAPQRAMEALKEIQPFRNEIELLTCAHSMGEDEARTCGFNPMVIVSARGEASTPEDTSIAAAQMLRLPVDLILFAGGDGTARDIHATVGTRIPVLGIPTGVKMHSGVFAVNPRSAGRLAILFLKDEVPLSEAEVMDIDEEAFRQNRLDAKLYGYLRVPSEGHLIQGVKVGVIQSEPEALEEIASLMIDNMEDDYLYIIGPGTTTKSISKKLGLSYSLLGVDVIHKKNLIATDVNERELLSLLEGKKAKLIVTIIGGQGFIFGRGNKQLSHRVIKKIGKDNIMVVATEGKIASLRGKPLLVDTENQEVDQRMRGYIRIVTGYRRTIVYQVA